MRTNAVGTDPRLPEKAVTFGTRDEMIRAASLAYALYGGKVRVDVWPNGRIAIVHRYNRTHPGKNVPVADIEKAIDDEVFRSRGLKGFYRG